MRGGGGGNRARECLEGIARVAPDQGGVARALAYVQKRRAELPNVLVLNGGDMWNSGTPAWSDKYYGDCPEWRWFSEHLGAMAFGNHDVDYGWDALIACRDKVKYPILSGNLVDKDGKQTTVQDISVAGLNLQPDARTNSIIAVGSASRIRNAEELIALLDVPDGTEIHAKRVASCADANVTILSYRKCCRRFPAK